MKTEGAAVNAVLVAHGQIVSAEFEPPMSDGTWITLTVKVPRGTRVAAWDVTIMRVEASA